MKLLKNSNVAVTNGALNSGKIPTKNKGILSQIIKKCYNK